MIGLNQAEFFQRAFTVMNVVCVHRLKSEMILLPLMGGDAQGVSAPREAGRARASVWPCTHTHARTH